MKNEQSITPAEDIQTFPLETLFLSALNPRQDVTAVEVGEMAASIRTCGLIQNLAGIVDDSGKVGIVAGGRRLRALQHMADTGDKIAGVPVKLAKSEAEAQTWAVAENAARAELQPADEIRAYGEMAKSGYPVSAIASAFAVTEPHVQRRLKLAALPTVALDALKAGQVSLTSAQHMTLAKSDDQITEALEAIKAGRFRYAEDVKRFFTQAGIDANDRRVKFVGLEAYEAEGGAITRDMFSDDVIWHDEAMLDRLFAVKLEATADLIEAGGWKWAETIEESYLSYNFIQERSFGRLYKIEGELTEAEAERYDELAELANSEVLDETGQAELTNLQEQLDGAYSAEQMAIAGCVICVARDGTVECSRGLVRKEDQEAAYKAELLPRPYKAETTKADGPKSPYSNALADDLRAIELGAVQTALLSKPDLVLDLLAFHLSADSGAYPYLMDIRLDGQKIVPTKNAAYAPDERLDKSSGSHSGPKDVAAAFAKFQKKGRKQRNAELTSSFARVFNYGCGEATAKSKASLFEVVAKETSADMRAIWTPTAETFFDRVKADYLNDLYKILFAVDDTDVGYKSFVSQKKGAKAGYMGKVFSDAAKAVDMTNTPANAESIARIKAWRPTGY